MKIRINKLLIQISIVYLLILSGFFLVVVTDLPMMKSQDMKGMQEMPGMKGMKKMPEMKDMMRGMPPDYEVFINDGTKNEVGVMVFTHGGWKTWDKKVTDAVKKYKTPYPTVICFGMAMMQSEHIQKGIDDLERSGVKKIIIIPLFVGKYNEVARHYRYLFGLEKTSLWARVKKVNPKAKIIYQPEVHPLSPLIVQTMTTYAREISVKPKNERVIIIGHGPSGVKDNQQQERDLNSMAQLIKKEIGFKEIIAKNLQDDNYRQRPKNVKAMREIITEWSQKGDVIVLTFLMSRSSRGIQPKIKRDLKGLKYKYKPTGLSEHKNFALWIKKSIDDAPLNETL